MALPDDAGMGLTPAREANAASERSRSLWDQAAIATAAVTGLIPGLSSSVRAGLRRRTTKSPPVRRATQSIARAIPAGVAGNCVVDCLAVRGDQDRHGVGLGVGVHTDDERVSAGDDGHCRSFLIGN